MLRLTLLLLSFAALIPFLACAAPPQNSATVAPAASPASAPASQAATPAAARADVVTASAQEVRLRAGGSGEASVRLRIADGFHVNANPPSDKFYIGTELSVASAEGVTPGKPVYPAAVNRQFRFADKPLAVYEGTAEIKLPLAAAASAGKGARTLPARIRVQPCNDQECFPPRTIETPIAVTID